MAPRGPDGRVPKGKPLDTRAVRTDPYDVVKGPFVSPTVTPGSARRLQSQRGESLREPPVIYVPQALSVNGRLNLCSGGQSRWLRSQKAQTLPALGEVSVLLQCLLLSSLCPGEGVGPANGCSGKGKINPSLSLTGTFLISN